MAERDWIVGLGEVLWDVFPDAACFGGAPANFACHARALGAAHTAMVSAVGPTTDPLAEKAIDELRAHGLDTRWIQRNSNQTGRVFVEIDALGQPSYRFAAQPAWDWIDWSADLADLASQTAVVCFGTLAQRNAHSRATIHHFLQQVPRTGWRIFDVNLRGDFWTEPVILESLRMANVLKLNQDELPIVASACGIVSQGIDALNALMRKFALQWIAYTEGSRGATLLHAEDHHFCAAPSVAVVDTVGAGDAYTAALAIGLLRGWPLERINALAVEVAGVICTFSGATPTIPDNLIQRFALP